MSCINILSDFSKTIDECNLDLIKNMTHTNTIYDNVCDQLDINYETYYEKLKDKYEKIMNDLINSSDSKINIEYLLYFKNFLNEANNKQNIDDVFNKILSSDYVTNFSFSQNMIETLKYILKIIIENCSSKWVDMNMLILQRYKKKIFSLNNFSNIKLSNVDKKKLLSDFYTNIESKTKNFIENKSNNMKILDFSIENELETLIPNEIGAMKKFFIKVISTYFNNLHPIIWGQVLKGLINHIFTELPLTKGEMFSYVSKHLLLNSGPFILKILQLIRPALPDDVAKKYNLTKLSYPKLTKKEYSYILENILIDYHNIKILGHFSASVGHVCMGYNIKDKSDKFVIKIVKPLSIAQSCWEYSILHNIYPYGSCERNFIVNTLKSNGFEMNVNNEIENLNHCYELYTTTYNDEFKLNSSAKLTTIQHKEGLIKENTWFSLAMTLAPGVPLADIIDDKLLDTNTKLRSNLHRCVDLLVVKFFFVLISTGIYHGDLHSGNIFYSYKKNQITLIDFGAVGELNLFNGDDDNLKILEIVIMSIHYNYDGILDVLTDIMNNKCTNDKDNKLLDKNSKEYLEFKKKLSNYKIQNIKNSESEKKKYDNIVNKIFSQTTIDTEKLDENEVIQEEIKEKTIYDSLEIDNSPEVIVQDKDILPELYETMGNSTSITFSGVMEEIIKFYATNNINIAIKFAELNEFQKAYGLLLGVLTKINYNSYRTSKAIKTAIITMKNLKKLANIKSTKFLLITYYREYKNLRTLKKSFQNLDINISYTNKIKKNIKKIFQSESINTSDIDNIDENLEPINISNNNKFDLKDIDPNIKSLSDF